MNAVARQSREEGNNEMRVWHWNRGEKLTVLKSLEREDWDDGKKST